MNDSKQALWVIGKWTGDEAKRIIDHANAGIGYFVIKTEMEGRTPIVEAAFRRPTDTIVPEHLVVADDYMIDKLDKMYQERHGYNG